MNLQRLRNGLERGIRLANHDFCPQLNRYISWLKKPIGWVVTGMVFSLLAGALIGPQGYVLAFAFLALLLIGLSWPWLSMKGIRCELICPDSRLSENQEVSLVLKVRNFWPLPVFGLMVKGDFLQELTSDEEPVVFSLTWVPAFSESEFGLSIKPTRRGILPSSEVHVINGFPFGLIDVSRVVAVSNRAVVWPACVSLDGQPPALGIHLNVAGVCSNRSGNDGETIGVRGYHHGDRLRNIHWAQTVRSQRLMVRERQSMTSSTATVLVDLSPDHHTDDNANSSFEWAIRIAASICRHFHLMQSPVQVHVLGLTQHSETRTTNRFGIHRLMDFFAHLPTREEALETLVDGSRAASDDLKPIQSGGRVFFVGTCRSPQVSSLTRDIVPVFIELDGFGMDHPIRESSRGTGRGDRISVSTAHAASSQLEQGWSRSFASVEC